MPANGHIENLTPSGATHVTPAAVSDAEAALSPQEELSVAQEDLHRIGELLNEQAHVVEQSQVELKKKVARLSELSIYRPGFLTDMSYSLRSPLNTMLILAQQLEDNHGNTMSEEQVEYATVIRSAGNNLLEVINRFLHVAKSESGTLAVREDGPPTVDGLRSRIPVRQSNSVDVEAFAGVRVFIVDDHFNNIFAMKALLERGGAIVSFAESGQAAVDLLQSGHDVDIVLMDIRMPGMDGYQTLRAIRRLEAGKDLPLVAVTAEVRDGERQRCLDAGANDYVTKPVDTRELMSAISPWLPTLVAAIKPGPRP